MLAVGDVGGWGFGGWRCWWLVMLVVGAWVTKLINITSTRLVQRRFLQKSLRLASPGGLAAQCAYL